MRKTAKYLKTLEKAEAKKEFEEAQLWRTEGETQFEEDGGDLDPEQVRQGREEETAHVNAMCDEEEWVELPDEFKKFGKYAKLKREFFGIPRG